MHGIFVGWVAQGFPKFRETCAAFVYEGVCQPLIHGLKGFQNGGYFSG